jgi:hypothetical protein
VWWRLPTITTSQHHPSCPSALAGRAPRASWAAGGGGVEADRPRGRRRRADAGECVSLLIPSLHPLLRSRARRLRGPSRARRGSICAAGWDAAGARGSGYGLAVWGFWISAAGVALLRVPSSRGGGVGSVSLLRGQSRCFGRGLESLTALLFLFSSPQIRQPCAECPWKEGREGAGAAELSPRGSRSAVRRRRSRQRDGQRRLLQVQLVQGAGAARRAAGGGARVVPRGPVRAGPAAGVGPVRRDPVLLRPGHRRGAGLQVHRQGPARVPRRRARGQAGDRRHGAPGGPPQRRGAQGRVRGPRLGAPRHGALRRRRALPPPPRARLLPRARGRRALPPPHGGRRALPRQGDRAPRPQAREHPPRQQVAPVADQTRGLWTRHLHPAWYSYSLCCGNARLTI